MNGWRWTDGGIGQPFKMKCFFPGEKIKIFILAKHHWAVCHNTADTNSLRIYEFGKGKNVNAFCFHLADHSRFWQSTSSEQLRSYWQCNICLASNREQWASVLNRNRINRISIASCCFAPNSYFRYFIIIINSIDASARACAYTFIYFRFL